MKKTKLLMPILGVGAVAATVAPMVAMTGCNKDEEKATWILDDLFEVSDSVGVYRFNLKYNRTMDAKIEYSITQAEVVSPSEICYVDNFLGTMTYETKTVGGDLIFNSGLSYLDVDTAVKMEFKLQMVGSDKKPKVETYTITINCPKHQA